MVVEGSFCGCATARVHDHHLVPPMRGEKLAEDWCRKGSKTLLQLMLLVLFLFGDTYRTHPAH